MTRILLSIFSASNLRLPSVHCTLRVLSLFLFICLFSSCSHVNQMKTAEQNVSVSVAKVDQTHTTIDTDFQKKLSRVADYDVMLKHDLQLPQTVQTQKAALEVLTLSLNVAGPSSTAEAQLDKMMDDIIRDDLQAHQDLVTAQNKDDSLSTELTQAKNALTASVQQRDQYIGIANAMALVNASTADTQDHLMECVYAFCAIGAIVLILWSVATFGGKAATAVTTVASKL